jgi:hypothetical protein
MAVGLSVKVTGAGEVRASFKEFEAFLKDSKLILQTAEEVRNVMVKRTLKGLDVNLRPFAPYSTDPLYMPVNHRPKPQGGRNTKKRGRDKGKPMKTVFYKNGYAQFSRETKGEGAPNLFATGDMFRAFQRQKQLVRGTRAFVLFTRRNSALKASGNNRKREFVGINTGQELPIIQRNFIRRLNSALRKAKLG